MRFFKGILLLAAAGGLAACDNKIDKTVDRGFDAKDLSTLKPGYGSIRPAVIIGLSTMGSKATCRNVSIATASRFVPVLPRRAWQQDRTKAGQISLTVSEKQSLMLL